MKMTTSTEWLLSFVIPEVTSSPEEQIATLKRTLSKLDTLPNALKEGVFLDMLRYMLSLDSGGMLALKEYILDALTETELEGLLNLVEYAREQLKNQEYKKSATPSSGLTREQTEEFKRRMLEPRDSAKKGALLIFPNQKNILRNSYGLN